MAKDEFCKLYASGYFIFRFFELCCRRCFQRDNYFSLRKKAFNSSSKQVSFKVFSRHGGLFMKQSQILLFILVNLPALSFAAENLLRCNTPSGSGLVEVQVYTQESKYFVKALNAFGSMERPVRITKTAWDKKDISWKSTEGGNIHLYLPKEGSGSWVFDSRDLGWNVYGYCR